MNKLSLNLMLSGFLTLVLLIAGLLAFNAQPSFATFSASPTPSCGTFTYDFGNDGNNGRVSVDFESSDQQIDVSGINGWTVTKVELNVENDGHAGFYQYSTSPLNNFNPNPGNDIDDARVTVTKSCASATATATATATSTTSPSKVYVCKYVGTPGVNETLQTGQNPIEVSVNAIPNGWSIGAFFSDQQGRSYVLATVPQSPEPNASNCPQNGTPTSTPTATATATATGTGRGEPTETPTSTPEPTPTTPSCASDQHLDASGRNCVSFSVPGSGSGTGGAPVGQVLGASTMAATGAITDALFNSIFTLGSLLTSFGIMKNGRKNKN